MIKHKHIVFLFLAFIISPWAVGQQMQRIRGKVVDADTKEPLPFVNIAFVGKNIGTISDYKGEYEIKTQWASKTLSANYLGYEPATQPVGTDKLQIINFMLKSKNVSLQEVEVAGKRKRYRNKNNPAVDLIKKVLAHRQQNRLEANSFYDYDKYEKIEFDLNNVTEKLQKSKAMRNFQFVFDYVDTSEVNGKPFLPIFLQETLSKVYYRKQPKATKEHVSGVNTVGLHDYIDNEGIGMILDNIYQDVDLYDNNINLLTQQFTSPISPLAASVYKFHILDTTSIEGYNCIELAFQPRNKADFAFKGSLFIANDSTYSLKGVKMKVSEGINLNFVNDLQIEQNFARVDDGSWIKTKDVLTIDFNIFSRGMGIFGKRTVHTDNYVFGKAREKEKYDGVQNTLMASDYRNKDTSFWQQNRIVDLSQKEEDIYFMVDSVQNVPAFKRTMDIVMLLAAGYWNFNKIDVGPVNTFYSWNDVEGFRLRVGGRTSDKFSKTMQLDGYVLYGFKDKRFKYSMQFTQSLNKKPLKERPHHNLSVLYQRETNFPGMEMMFINEDNFLLSIKRGKADKLIYYDMFRTTHSKDWGNGISTTFFAKYMKQQPGGSLYFDYAEGSVSEIISSELTAVLRFAPNEVYYQGLNYRVPMFNKFPILQLTFTQGFKDVFKSDYRYTKLKLNVFKRFYLSVLGYTDVEVEGGKVIGKVPYPLMFLHRANQTYSYQLRSYNLMNFLEFVSDEYVSLFAEHHFNGFILNKIPLVKHLKLRSIVSFKAIYGDVTQKNNPRVTPDLMLFPTDATGQRTTYILGDAPYMEMSIGIGNIFKIFRVDVVRRLSYLDHPNVAEYGLRARFKLDF